jgi:uncharacterized membrane protein HdeD (DUF308 family)
MLAAVLGILPVARPLRGILTLTLSMTPFFVVEGIGNIFIAMDFRRHLNSWGWTLVSGLINLCLDFLIWKGWPYTATWVMGLFVGINMIFVGIPLTFAATAAQTRLSRRAVERARSGAGAGNYSPVCAWCRTADLIELGITVQ